MNGEDPLAIAKCILNESRQQVNDSLDSIEKFKGVIEKIKREGCYERSEIKVMRR